MPTTRTTIRRTPRRLRITARAVDLFNTMEALVGGEACDEWWEHHWALHCELKLKPWQWPCYGNFENDRPGVLERYLMLQAASDARKRT